MPDTLRDGRYVVLGKLGEGSQGATFDGIDKRPHAAAEGPSVAIKRFDVRGARSWKDVEMAEREARVLQSLSHPKLPAYIDHFEEDGALYLVMEKFEGESVARLRRRGVALGEADVVRLLRDASEVLDYLHRRSPPVIHRDLKPGNVIRRPDGSFVFVDFGAVRDKLRPEGGSTVVGTFGFMAPEQFQGRALPASDVYAIGATAMAMLTGKEPEELPHKGLAIDVRTALKGLASERLMVVLEAMLEPDPDRRVPRLAPRIAPLLAQVDDRPPVKKSKADAFRGERARDAARRAKRLARKEARRAERDARRRTWVRARKGHILGGPIGALLILMFSLGIVAVALTNHVLVPLLLRLLSILFPRAELGRVADEVREVGDTAIENLRRSRDWVRGVRETSPSTDDVRVRVVESAPEVRVATEGKQEIADREEEPREDARKKRGS